MDLNREPRQIASAAAEEVRALNHRTLDPKAFTQPGDVSDTANSVASIVERLPQALNQMAAGLSVLEEAGRIRMDDGSQVAVRAEEARQYLMAARDGLDGVLADLRRATGPLSHMGGLWEDEEDDTE
jgi:hypothetical protein